MEEEFYQAPAYDIAAVPNEVEHWRRSTQQATEVDLKQAFEPVQPLDALKISRLDRLREQAVKALRRPAVPILGYDSRISAILPVLVCDQLRQFQHWAQVMQLKDEGWPDTRTEQELEYEDEVVKPRKIWLNTIANKDTSKRTNISSRTEIRAENQRRKSLFQSRLHSSWLSMCL